MGGDAEITNNVEKNGSERRREAPRGFQDGGGLEKKPSSPPHLLVLLGALSPSLFIPRRFRGFTGKRGFGIFKK